MFITIIIHVVLPKYNHKAKVLPSEWKKVRKKGAAARLSLFLSVFPNIYMAT